MDYHRSRDTRCFKIEKGVRQGCVLSSMYLNIYCKELVNKALQDEAGLIINRVVVYYIRFADDTVLLASNFIKQMKAAQLWHGVSCEKDKGYRNGKTTRSRIKNKVKWDNIRKVNEYKCIGTFITADPRSMQEIKRRIRINHSRA